GRGESHCAACSLRTSCENVAYATQGQLPTLRTKDTSRSCVNRWRNYHFQERTTVRLLTDSIDLQATAPAISLGLDEVGVTGIMRGIVLGTAATATTARFDIATSLAGDARGAHMSRFHEAIDHALALVADEG